MSTAWGGSLHRTYVDAQGAARCTECWRPAIAITPDERLYLAAKRVQKYFDAKLTGKYFSQHEDLLAARELHDAITAVEQARAQDELMARR